MRLPWVGLLLPLWGMGMSFIMDAQGQIAKSCQTRYKYTQADALQQYNTIDESRSLEGVSGFLMNETLAGGLTCHAEAGLTYP
jgi:hypothetical protein